MGPVGKSGRRRWRRRRFESRRDGEEEEEEELCDVIWIGLHDASDWIGYTLPLVFLASATLLLTTNTTTTAYCTFIGIYMHA